MSGSTTQGVLFDLDNTLAHRGPSIASYARCFVRDFGERLEDTDGALVARLIDDAQPGPTIAALDELEPLLLR